MDKISPLLVLLTCDFKDEKICELLKDITSFFPTSEQEHAKQVKILSCADIFGAVDEEVALDPIVAIQKLQKIMKPPANDKDIYVYLLYDYPINLSHMVDMVNNSTEYSVLDGIVKLVSKPSGDVKSSMHGPNTTVAEVPPVLVIETQDKALSKFDVDAVLQNYKAKQGGLWTDITYDEFNVMHMNTFTNSMEDMSIPLIVDHIAEMMIQMCHLKSEFKDWNSKKTMTNLPTDAAAVKRIQSAVLAASEGDYEARIWRSTPMYRSYLRTINNIPRRVRGVGAVLFSIVDAVCHDPDTVRSLQDGAPVVPADHMGLGLEDGSIGSTGEKPFHMLKQGYNIAVKNLEQNAFTVHEGDAFHSRILNVKDILLRNDNLDPDYASATAVFGFERDAVFAGHVPRLIGQGGMPLHATIPIKERSVQETELLTFTALSAFDFHRYNQLIYFNRMVERGVPPRIDFTGLRRAEDGGGDVSSLKRKYFKNIPAFTLPQIFAKELMKEPVVSREYYPMTDELLLCLYWPPPKRRIANKSWCPAQRMHLRPNFEQFLVFSERNNFTPRTVASIHNCLDIQRSEMERYREDTVFITPADKSVVLVKQACSVQKAWVTIYNKEVMFGLRQLDDKVKCSPDSSEGMFFLQTDDDVRTMVTVGASAEMCPGKPDRNGTICMTILFPDELRVSACSDGIVTISSPIVDPTLNSKSSPGKAATRALYAEKATALMAPEVKRLACNGGCIIRCLDIGGPFTRDIYFPDGTRVLVRDMNNIDVDSPDQSIPNYKYPVSGIMEAILREAPVKEGGDGPLEWTYVVLDTQGRVLYSFEDYDEIVSSENQMPESERVMHQSTAIPDISQHYIDAETEALVTEYKDGRVICISTDDLRDVYFPEGTRVVTHQSGEVISIDRYGHPKLEIDAEIDSISRRHSRGFKVPIAKGGDKTRTKMVLPDGTAVLIKYDTKVTSTYNGSVKAIRRDKSVVYAIDGGLVSYVSADEWNNKAKEDFEEEKKDAELKPRDKPLLDRRKVSCNQRSVSICTASNTSVTIGQSMRIDGTGMSNRHFPTTGITMAESMGVTESPTTTKKFKRRKPKKLAQLGLSTSPKRFQAAVVEEEEAVVLEPKSTAAKYNFDLNVSQCVIEDHENNIFDIDLMEDPTKPLVSLAGEVEGCKPAAVAATNIEPRLFVIGRSADAVEICRYEEVEELDKAFNKCNEDYIKYTTDVICPPCNLGGALQHSFFCHKKMQSSWGFSFADVFAERTWTSRDRPAALSIALRRQQSRYLAAEDERKRKQKHDIFVTKTFIESAPLSDEGYANVADDIARWEEFRKARDKTELTFAIEDHRTDEEKKEEGDMIKKLKGMYKAHRNAKKKESERNKSALPLAGDLPVIAEAPDEPDDEFDAASRDDEEGELTPEEIELNDAFDTFAVKDMKLVSSGDSITSTLAGCLDIDSLQNVFIQVFNRFISFDYISDAYYDDTGLPLDEGEDITFDYDMFRRIHYHLQTRFAEEEMASEATSLVSGINGKASTGTDDMIFADTDGGLRGSFGSARGSGIMAVRNMNKTMPASAVS